jgi:glutathione S-transferase
MWMDWQQTTLIPDMTIVFWGLIRTPEDQRDHGAIEAASERLGVTWQVLEAHLAGRRFVAGERLTIGDIPVGAACHRYLGLPIERPALPNLEAWYEGLKQRPAYREHVMLPIT